jgi:indole-3-glycerol phosphate synthase
VSILDEIIERKHIEVAEAKRRRSEDELASRAREVAEPTRGFRATLAAADAPAIIAEVKRRSPSKGEIRPDFDPVACGLAYANHGAACISVLTDEHFFGGHLDYLEKIRQEVDQPLLRKDFTIDRYQIDEARVFGADAILLIVSALTADTLRELRDYARGLDLDVLVEVHDEAELDLALAIDADLIGVNNRNLNTFVTDLAVCEELAARMGDRLGRVGEEGILLVGESGIADRDDISRLEAVGVRAFLVGESLMRQPDPGEALDALRAGRSGT